MSQDFAKKTKKRGSASRFKNKDKPATIPGWIWLVAGLLIGAIVMFALRSNVFDNKKQTVVEKPKEKPSAESEYQAVPAAEITPSDFSFHTELVKKEINIDDDVAQLPIKKRKEISLIMQCGSFRKKSSAENLKAQIAMNGFSANINPTVEKSGMRWFRVTLGPYKSKRMAERERHQLERNNINNCKIW